VKSYHYGVVAQNDFAHTSNRSRNQVIKGVALEECGAGILSFTA
jgi:hypothetical protein